jgi:hypothetical protein
MTTAQSTPPGATNPGTGEPRPTLPAAAQGTDPEALKTLRRFHVDPMAEPGGQDGGVPDGVLPALLFAQRDPARVRTDEPYFLGPSEGTGGSSRSLTLPLPDLLGRLISAEDRLLADNLLRLERRARERMTEEPGPADARELLSRAAEVLAEELDLGDQDRERLRASLDGFLEAVPAGGVLLPFRRELPLRLLAAAVRDRLPAAREAFAAEVRGLVTALDGRLEVDRRRRAEGSKEDLGDLGDRFVDSAALSGVVGERRGGTGLTETRRKRLEQARKDLAGFTDGVPSTVVVQRDKERDGERDGESGGETGVDAIEGLRLETAYDPCARAVEIFDQAADELTRTLAAARRARLVADGTYVPERHDPWLDRLSWRDLSKEELQLLPPVVARVSADWLARGGMASLSRLLFSGRTVQVLVEVDPAEQPGGGDPGADDPLTGFRFEAGYLGLGHREVFVQQGTAARPARLLDGFHRALATDRPALHVVAVPGRGDPTRAWIESGAALEGRAHPIFLYDPEAGPTWAQRMDFTGNPSPRDDWPVAELPAVTAAGADQVLELAFTFADYALLSADLAAHFHAVPEGVPEAELTPLSAALAETERQAPSLPFVWAVDPEGRLLRLVVSRPLLVACRDRLDLWRTLQELAGVKSGYVEAAVERVRDELETRFAEEKERIEARHAEELEALRRTAAAEAADRMTAALLEMDLATVAALGPVAPAAGDGTGAASWAAIAGQSPDDVAARLLEMVSPDTLDPDAAPAGGSQADRMAEELMKLMGPEVEKETS